MAKTAKKNEPQTVPLSVSRRRHKVTVFFNDKEMDAINAYCKKYKVEARSALIREFTVRGVMGKFLDDYPTLFEKQDLDRLIVH